MAQVIISVLTLAGIILTGAAHALAGNIVGFGYILLAIFIVLGLAICRTAWREYKEEKDEKLRHLPQRP